MSKNTFKPNTTNSEPIFDPILHSELWTIVKNVSRYPDGSYEKVAVSELEALISNREKLLLDRVEKAADEVIDQFSVHVPKGRPKGTVAHRVMKKRMTKRLTTLRKELDGGQR